MSNYKRENLLNIAPAKVPAGTLAVKIGDDVFTAGNVKIRGTDVSNTTATQEDVIVGKYFYNNKGEFVPGLLDAALSGTGTFYKCTAVFGEDGDNILVSGATEAGANGIYTLEDKNAVGFNRVWSKQNQNEVQKYMIHATNAFQFMTWVLSRGSSPSDDTWLYETKHTVEDIVQPWLGEWVTNDSAYGNPPTVIHTETSTTPDCITFDQYTAPGRATHYYLLDDTDNMRIWQTADGEWRIIQNYVRGNERHNWVISKITDGYWFPYVTSDSTAAYPWEATSWYDTTVQEYHSLNLDYFIKPVSLARNTKKKWSGYKATLKKRVNFRRKNKTIKFSMDGRKFEFTYLQPGPGGTWESVDYKLYESDLQALVNVDMNLEGNNRVFFSQTSFRGWLILHIDGAWYLQKEYEDGYFKTATAARLVAINPVGTWDTSVCTGDAPNAPVTSEWVEWDDTEVVTYDWELEEFVTDNLDWGKGFTPQVGRIYDAEATVACVLSESEPGPSAPENMTTYENDEWLVSADNEFGGTKAWNAFDGNPDSIWATGYGSSELTWRNKIRSVLVRQLEITYNADAHVNDHTNDVTLYGSNNGTDWVNLGMRSSISYTKDSNGYATAVLTFPDNKVSYFYHKIRGNASISIRNVIGTLTAKPKIDGAYDGGME